MHSVWFGEFMGTLVLLLLGDGVNAGVTLRKSYAANAGWLAVTAGWALAVLCGVMVAQAFGSPGANINPAITLAIAVLSGNYSQVLSMWSAQLLGAMAGAALMALHYAAHWKLTPDPAAKLGIFCTIGAVHSPALNILSETLGTAVLVAVVGAIFSHGVSANGPAAGLGPWHRPLAGWNHGLRHQPRARPRPAHRSLAAAYSRQRRIELELCAPPHHWRLCGSGTGRAAAAVCASVMRSVE